MSDLIGAGNRQMVNVRQDHIVSDWHIQTVCHVYSHMCVHVGSHKTAGVWRSDVLLQDILEAAEGSGAAH